MEFEALRLAMDFSKGKGLLGMDFDEMKNGIWAKLGLGDGICIPFGIFYMTEPEHG